MMQPSIAALRTWYEHEQRVLEIVRQALLELRRVQSLPGDEPGLNRELCLCLRRVNARLSREGRGASAPPIWEAQSQPLIDDAASVPREQKRPDFQWGFVNLQEIEDDHACMFYVIECKRLGQPCGRWVLNVNYVEEGIIRFVVEQHGYAKGTRSAAMVGYVQTMPCADVLNDVNAAATTRSLPPLTLERGAWSADGVTRLRHVLARSASLGSPFELRHLWVDVRR
jgi:hypothetical protein